MFIWLYCKEDTREKKWTVSPIICTIIHFLSETVAEGSAAAADAARLTERDAGAPAEGAGERRYPPPGFSAIACRARKALRYSWGLTPTCLRKTWEK